jgi:hypothetical protein
MDTRSGLSMYVMVPVQDMMSTGRAVKMAPRNGGFQDTDVELELVELGAR